MSNRKISEVTKTLIDAKALIADEKHWCQGDWQNGVSYCSMGALYKTSLGEVNLWKIMRADMNEYVRLLSKHTGGEMVAQFNDSNTHDKVMEMWDAAIAESIMNDQLMKEGV